MTSQSSKNHQTIRANTLNWNRPDLCLLAILVGLILFEVSPTLAGDELLKSDSTHSTESIEPSMKSAAERWKRLKARYQTNFEKSEAEKVRKLDAPLDNQPSLIEGSNVPSSLLAPQIANDVEEKFQNGFGSGTIQNSLPLLPPRPVLPFDVVDDSDSWVFPAPAGPSDEPDPSEGGILSPDLAEESNWSDVDTSIDSDQDTDVDSEHSIPRSPAGNSGRRQSELIAMNDSQNALTVSVRYRKISSISPFLDRSADGYELDRDIRDWAKKQSEDLGLNIKHESYPGRFFPQVPLVWEASNFFHYPLYFEDPALERYGHTYSSVVQPIVSIGRFGCQVVTLPYHMAIDPSCREVYSLGWYRPGECAPKLHYPVQLNLHPSDISGLVFLVP